MKRKTREASGKFMSLERSSISGPVQESSSQFDSATRNARSSSAALEDDKEKLSSTKVENASNDAPQISKENDVKVADAAMAQPEVVVDAATDAGSKKRAREDDDGAEEQRDVKKVDLKVEES